MDNQQPKQHEHQFLDYGEEFLKCPCGAYSEKKGSGKKLADDRENGNKDEAKRLNDVPGERRIQDLKDAEAQFPSRPTAPRRDEDGSQAEGKGAKQPTLGTMTGSPHDVMSEPKDGVKDEKSANVKKVDTKHK